jgi:xanthine dehydrogenase YagT iron-sulfur-binding subunit
MVGAPQVTTPHAANLFLKLRCRALPAFETVRPIARPADQFEEITMHFKINGEAVDTTADIRTSLLDLLRNTLGFTGTKKGCDQGACGACTVLVDGERINSCLALAVQCQGKDITTVEGLANNGNLHWLQQAFIEHDGFQCGYCTPGQLCSAIGMAGEIQRNIPSVVTQDLCGESIEIDDTEIRERMSGNLCRCGAYNGIVEAIRETMGRAQA